MSHPVTQEMEKKKRNKKRLIALVIILFGMSTLFFGAQFWKNQQTVKTVNVSGCKELSDKEIVELSGIKKGQKIKQINLQSVERKVESNPIVRSAMVKVEWPWNIVIQVKEREPIARLVGEKSGMIDGNGRTFPIKTKGSYDVPLITGIKSSDIPEAWGVIKNEQIREIVTVLRRVREVNPVIYYLISEIRPDGDQGFKVFTNEGTVPLLIQADNAVEQLIKFKAFWSQVISVAGYEKFKYIDLRYTDVIATKE